MLKQFQAKLSTELANYAREFEAKCSRSYGIESSILASEVGQELMADRKHVCGLFTLIGYYLEDGKNEAMIYSAAWAMELLHASIRLFSLGKLAAGRLAEAQAYVILANLDAAESDRVKVLSITAHTQLLKSVAEQSTDHSDWNGPHYRYLNPIHVGIVLAGGDCGATDGITQWALNFDDKESAVTLPYSGEKRALLTSVKSNN